MPKWIQLPAEPLKYNPYQAAFWAARRARLCKACKTEFESVSSNECPTCKQLGLRKYNRLTLLAGRRGGKTKAASIAAVEEACIPNSVIWACAPTDPKLVRYVLPAIQQLIPESWVKSWSSEYKDLRLKNNSLIHFQTLEDPDQGRGQGLDAVWIDECCELTEDHWNVLRPSLTERRGVAILSSSPRSYDWVWERFFHEAEKGTPGFWACRYKTADNPIISPEEIADAKATMPSAFFQQEYEADFVIFTGAVYGGAVDPQILRTAAEVQEIIPEWPNIASWRQVLVGIDTGADHPFGAVKLVSTEKGLVVIGEYLERHRSFIEHAYSIRTLAGSATAKYAINKNERQPMIELAQHGVVCQPSENDVVSGTERVKSWLHAKQLFFVESHCPQTIKQMKAYRWAPDKTKDGQVRKERVYKKEDELPDCVRYALMTWPRLPDRIMPDTKRDITKLPAEMQAVIIKMREWEKKQESQPKPEDNDFVGDFWL